MPSDRIHNIPYHYYRTIDQTPHGICDRFKLFPFSFYILFADHIIGRASRGVANIAAVSLIVPEVSPLISFK